MHITGLACRLPADVNTPSKLHRFLKQQQNGITAVPPPSRWMITAVPPSRWNPADFPACTTHRAGYIEHIDHFDYKFFKINRTEADNMDPNQRLALEVAYEALVDAGAYEALVDAGAYEALVDAGLLSQFEIHQNHQNHCICRNGSTRFVRPQHPLRR